MDRLLDQVKRLFSAVPEAAGFLACWPTSGQRDCPAMNLPVCDWLTKLTPASALTQALCETPLQWRQTYGAADFGDAFLRGYGWAEFIGLRGPVPSTQIACGVLLLAPGITYPSHAHQAEELYLPIAGVADWQKGHGDFAPVPVGQAIHHPSWTPHAMRVGAEPLAALYLWRGGDLAAKSVILPE
jgi:hypothetical protein